MHLKMRTIFALVAVLAVHTKSALSYRPHYRGEFYGHPQNRQNIEDLMKWWEHETPDWAKSREHSAGGMSGEHYYHPHNYPGSNYDSSEEEYDDDDRGPSQGSKFDWRPGSIWSRPVNEGNNKFQNRPRPVPIIAAPNDAQRPQPIDVQLANRKTDPNNEFSDFATTTQPSSTRNLGSRVSRQTSVDNFFATQAPTDNLEECLRNCPVTSEYNPVCGTDNITYYNHGRLVCAQFCGVAVSVRRNSPCPVSGFGTDEGINTPRPPPTNRPSTVDMTGRTSTQSPGIQACLNSCPNRGDRAQVCGTDGVTYDSPGHLLCAQLCGVDVKVRQLSPCPMTSNILGSNLNNNFGPGNLVDNGSSSNPANPLSNTGRNPANNLGTRPSNNNFGSSTNNFNSGSKGSSGDKIGDTEISSVPPHLRSCVRTCPTTSEHNPVCGSNKVIYSNPSRLTCARICGIDVQTRPLSFCKPATSAPPPSPSTSTEAPTTQSTLECASFCPITSETKPVCGTNGVTYKNPAHFQCIKSCGVDIDVKGFSTCASLEQTTASTLTDSFTNSQVTEGTTQASANSTRFNGLDFIIPSNILDNVFINNTGASLQQTTASPLTDSFTNSQVTEGTTQSGSKTTDVNGLDFTIPANILDNVFTTNTVESTSESVIDDELIRIND